jgi:single-strand DNA-binding protein
MNKVYLIGNLTKDPEMRATQMGVSVCNFSIAVGRRFKDSEGNQQTDFFDIVAWRQLGDLCGKYLRKGKKVAITGSIQTHRFTDKNGVTRTGWDIIADEVEFLTPQDTGMQKEMEHRIEERRAIAQEPEYAPADKGFTTVEDEELPF